MPRQPGKTSPRTVRDRQRAADAAQLRMAGKTWDEIAKAARYSDKSSAQRAVQRFLVQQEPDAEDIALLTAIEDGRLDRYLRALDEGITEGSSNAINTAIRISERRAKLHGLDRNEARLAAAAEAQVTVDAATASVLLDVVGSVMQQLGLSAPQMQRWPELFRTEIERQGLLAVES